MRYTTSAIHRPTIKRTAVLWGPHRNQQSVPHGESGGRSYLVDLAVYVAPTYDFIQELRKFGSPLEVLEPAHLRDEFKEKSENLAKMYEK